jgi:hypothetical protein
MIKECSDGYKGKSCDTKPTNQSAEGAATPKSTGPYESIECKAYVDEKNCTIKECTNGYRVSSCEISAECEKKTDENGCIVKSCSDGYSATECPKDKEKESVECKKYEENGCTVTVCTDGYNDKVCKEVPATASAAGGGSAKADPIGGFFKWLGRLFGGNK